MKKIILTTFVVICIFALTFTLKSVCSVIADTTPSFNPPSFPNPSAAPESSVPVRGSNTIAKGTPLTMGISLTPPPLPLPTEVVIKTARQPILRVLPDGMYEITIR